MNETSAIPARQRENQFFEIGVVGRKTGFTVPRDVKKGDDGFEDMDAYFLSDGSIHLDEDNGDIEQDMPPVTRLQPTSPMAVNAASDEASHASSSDSSDKNPDIPSSPLLMNSRALRASRGSSGPLIVPIDHSAFQAEDEGTADKTKVDGNKLSIQPRKANRIVDFSRIKASPDRKKFEPRRSTELPSKIPSSTPKDDNVQESPAFPDENITALQKNVANFTSIKDSGGRDNLYIQTISKPRRSYVQNNKSEQTIKPSKQNKQKEEKKTISQGNKPNSRDEDSELSIDVPLSMLNRSLANNSQKNKKRTPNKPLQESSINSVKEGESNPVVKRKRGRPRKNKLEIGNSVQTSEATQVKGAKKPAIRNAKKMSNEKDDSLNSQSDSASGEFIKTIARNNLQEIKQVEREDTLVGVRRSKRTRIAPLAFWKNERVVYELHRDENRIPALPEVKQIIRVDDPSPSIRQGRKKRHAKRSGVEIKSNLEAKSNDVEEYDAFYKDEINCEVLSWNEQNPKASEERVVGYSLPSVNLQQISNQQLKFASLFKEEPSFAAGVVEMPAGAEKPVKPSKHNIMSFCILQGKIEVTVNATTFRMKKDGVFIVPRGNYYSIKNIGKEAVRLYYTHATDTLENKRRGIGDFPNER